MKRLFAVALAAAACTGTIDPSSTDENPFAIRVGGIITATPGHRILGAGQYSSSVINWATHWVPAALVYMSINNGPESVIASGTTGSVTEYIYPGNTYVFRVRAGSTILAETSVTTQTPGTGFGMNYWPQHFGSETLNATNWPTLRPVVAEDMDRIVSLGGQTLRVFFWPGEQAGWDEGQPAGSRITPALKEMAANLPDLLSLANERGLAVIITFGNSYFDNHPDGEDINHPWWIYSYATFNDFMVDTLTWANTIIDAAEHSAYASTVIYYDYENEYYKLRPNMGQYLVDMYENSHVPPGKRGLSVLHQSDDTQDALTQLGTLPGANLGHRHLEYLDFHNYAAESGLDTATLESQMRAVAGDTTVILGEFGRQTPTSADERERGLQVASTA